MQNELLTIEPSIGCPFQIEISWCGGIFQMRSRQSLTCQRLCPVCGALTDIASDEILCSGSPWDWGHMITPSKVGWNSNTQIWRSFYVRNWSGIKCVIIMLGTALPGYWHDVVYLGIKLHLSDVDGPLLERVLGFVNKTQYQKGDFLKSILLEQVFCTF